MFFVEALVINIAVLLFLLFMLCQKLNGSLDCFEYRKYGISYNIISEQFKYVVFQIKRAFDLQIIFF